MIYEFLFFFFNIQPLPFFGFAAKNRGLISPPGTIRTIQFKFKYRGIFFFILHSAPSQIDRYSFEKISDISLRNIIFRGGNKLRECRFRILRSFSQHRPPYRFFALRKPSVGIKLHSPGEENPFPIFHEIEILIAFPYRLWICAAITEPRE